MTAIHSEEKNKEIYSFVYGDEVIDYSVLRKACKPNQKAKIMLRIYPEGDVIITAPHETSQAQIHETIKQKIKWIWDGLKEYQAQKSHIQPKQYISGEMQFYLGRRYVLKVIQTNEDKSQVKMTRGQIRVLLSANSKYTKQAIKDLVNTWYRQHAERVFKERLTLLYKQFSWVDDRPDFRIINMKKQWGSCSAKGTIIINPHLIKAPKECIDYVLIHELCHIKEYNHSPKFWRLVSSIMPHWKEVKCKLDQMAELYLNA